MKNDICQNIRFTLIEFMKTQSDRQKLRIYLKIISERNTEINQFEMDVIEAMNPKMIGLLCS